MISLHRGSFLGLPYRILNHEVEKLQWEQCVTTTFDAIPFCFVQGEEGAPIFLTRLVELQWISLASIVI